MTITYWIQHADYESEDFGLVGRPDAEAVFKKHNWKVELERKRALEAEGQDTCDPGIGFISTDKRILHLCPQASGRVLCHYHFDSTWRLFGVTLYRNQTQEYWFEEKRDAALEVVSRFFANDHKWMKQRSKTASKVFEEVA